MAIGLGAVFTVPVLLSPATYRQLNKGNLFRQVLLGKEVNFTNTVTAKLQSARPLWLDPTTSAPQVPVPSCICDNFHNFCSQRNSSENLCPSSDSPLLGSSVHIHN